MSIPFYPAVDIHSHFYHEHEVKEPRSERLYDATLPYLQDEYRRLKISAVGYSTFASVLSSEGIPRENDCVRALTETDDLAYQWVTVHPDVAETFSQADALLGEKRVLGIKIHPSSHKYTLRDKGESIFAFANERRAVVLMHPADFRDSLALADRYPDMRLIIAHLGSHEHINAIRNAKNGNIYTDTSGGASVQNNIVEYAVAEVGASRILFGTDTYALPFQYGRIVLSRISEEDKRSILLLNALSLFPHALAHLK